jgi:hypothetical protein
MRSTINLIINVSYLFKSEKKKKKKHVCAKNTSLRSKNTDCMPRIECDVFTHRQKILPEDLRGELT